MTSFGINTNFNPATGKLWGVPRSAKDNIYLNIVDRSNEFNLFSQLYLNRFKWSGKSLELYQKNSYIERNLFSFGMVGLYTHEHFGNIIIPAYPQGINPFGEPSHYLCQSYGGQINDIKSVKDVVIMRDNYHEDIPITFVYRYSQKTGDVQRTEEVYVRGLKSPNVLIVSANSKETAKLISDQILENEEVIVIRQSKGVEENIKPVALQTGRNAADLLKMVSYRRSKFNELLNYFGIQGDPEMKSAQMSPDEIKNNEIIPKIQLDAALKERQRAVIEAKEKFGFDLKVDLSDALKPDDVVQKKEKINAT